MEEYPYKEYADLLVEEAEETIDDLEEREEEFKRELTTCQGKLDVLQRVAPQEIVEEAYGKKLRDLIALRNSITDRLKDIPMLIHHQEQFKEAVTEVGNSKNLPPVT